MESLLTTEDVAEFFRVDVVTVRRMISKGELTAYRVGGEFRLSRGDIEGYLERHRLPAKTEVDGLLTTLTRRARKMIPAGTLSDIFEQFTKRAQAVLVLTQEEAKQLHHTYIGTEHLLLGILQEGDGVGAKLLREFGCDLHTMRQAVQDTVGRGPAGEHPQGEMPVTPRLKQVFEFAREEAKRFEHAHVGTEHLVLGLLREGEGVAGRLLAELGMNLNTTRSRVQEILANRDDR
jgi:excisionase family DNA binding protein